YADALSIGGFGQSLDDLRARLAVIRQHCETLDRPYERIEKITLYLAPVVKDGQLDATVPDTFPALTDLGFAEVMITPPPRPARLEGLAAELLPAAAEIAVNVL